MRNSGSRPLPRLGICGGGQLAKMTAQVAVQFGCEVVILERNPEFPADSVDTHTLIGDWNDPRVLLELASQVDVVTLENEFVDAGALAALERRGHPLWPSSATVRLVQDKLLQKETLSRAGLPVPRFRAAPDRDSVAAAGRDLGWPLMLKKRRNAYDGKGNARVAGPAAIGKAWDRLKGERDGLYVEEFCPFRMELAVIITRARDGTTAVYPVVETVNTNHICDVVKAPAAVPGPLKARAARVAQRAVEAVDGVGSFGIEMFLARDGALLVNELAPRVHNTGHYTIEACECCQFENHLRAVMGWPLGSTRMLAPAAAMVNLLGAGAGPGAPRGLEKALQVRDAHVHVYGKSVSARGRKMGHVTALGGTVAAALSKARRAARRIRFGAGGASRGRVSGMARRA